MNTQNANRRLRTLAAATLLTGIFAVPASHAATGDYCKTPLLYATNIRTACEQFGVNGLDALYDTSLHINGILSHAGEPAPTLIEDKGALRAKR